ncbi:MAG: FAD-dependent oxidoreductase [Oscillospiraceae bacterium]|nr:FAD-dependent oxidoreductase [Oscillospiraceae bacterium]
MKPYSHVFSPIRVAGAVLKNRIISAPSTIHTSSSGQPYPTEEAIRFFERRAAAGAGLVTCAGASIGGGHDDGKHCSWDLKVPNHTNRLCDLAGRIHLYGAKCTMELIGIFPDGYTVSDGCSIMGDPVLGREIPRDKMEWFKNEYIEAALALKASGFDGVMLHFGHSIPIAQFLSPYTNKRTDEYGGSTENRCRYPVEILKGIREAVGPDFIIDVRMSGTEFQQGGIDLDEGLRIAQQFQPYCDIIQASAGMHNPDWMTWTHPCGFLPPNPNVFIAEHFKKSGCLNQCYVSTIGGITSLDDCEEILSQGKADFVVVAREFIADPEWIHKAVAGKKEDVVPCIKCMRCLDSDNNSQYMLCAVNPRFNQEEAAAKIPAPAVKKKVAVIGGGPAGMYAALECDRLGHSVTLFEKQAHLGGLLEYADHVSFKWPLANYKNWLIAQLEKSNVTVRLNTEATPEMTEGFDGIIAALGSQPVIPKFIPGTENARTAVSAYGHEDELGKKTVIIGGGQVGLETAVHLQRLGLDVTLLEMLPQLAGDASKCHRDELMVEVRDHADHIHVLTGAKCTGIEPGLVRYEREGEAAAIKTDSVLLAVGLRPQREQADAFMHTADSFFEIGDCVKARTVEWCTREGLAAALNI